MGQIYKSKIEQTNSKTAIKQALRNQFKENALLIATVRKQKAFFDYR
jgi:hypothetical protein